MSEVNVNVNTETKRIELLGCSLTVDEAKALAERLRAATSTVMNEEYVVCEHRVNGTTTAISRWKKL